jgi:putative membrane protein
VERKDARMVIPTGLLTATTAFFGGWGIPLAPLFWLLVIVGIVLLVRGSGGRAPWKDTSRETGVDVLDRRLAEGELSLEQYRERRAALEERQ